MDFWKNNKWLLHLILGALLVAVYPMQQLFSGNQNVYFLWAMADFFPEVFANDPLLNSPNPYPAFSWVLTLFPAKLLPIWTTLLYVSLNAIYTFSFFGIANEVSKIYNNATKLFGFTLAFFVFHSSALWGTYFNLLTGFDLRWIWDSGIAEQGVLRGYLQPSVFGVFLLLSFYQAIKKNYVVAILCVIPAALFHANYLLLGCVLTVVYLAQSRLKTSALSAAALSALVVTPYALYLAQHFVFVDESFKNAITNAVQSGYESNIHLNPKNWLNVKLHLQIATVFIALIISWRRKWLDLFLVVIAVGIGLTTIAYVLNSSILISLNPWRLSVVVVPASVAILLGKWFNLHSKTSLLALLGASVTCAFGFLMFRVFGNGSEEFEFIWLLAQAIFLVSFIGLVLLARMWLNDKVIQIGLISSVLLLGVVGSYQGILEETFKYNSEQFQVIKKLKDNNSKGVYIVPSTWTSFRLNAKKPVFVDNNLVYGPALPSLVKRLEFLELAVTKNDYNAVISLLPKDVPVLLITDFSSKNQLNQTWKPLTDKYVLIQLRK